jgi:Leucine-rich repeat (LRR) protein
MHKLLYLDLSDNLITAIGLEFNLKGSHPIIIFSNNSLLTSNKNEPMIFNGEEDSTAQLRVHNTSILKIPQYKSTGMKHLVFHSLFSTWRTYGIRAILNITYVFGTQRLSLNMSNMSYLSEASFRQEEIRDLTMTTVELNMENDGFKILPNVSLLTELKTLRLANNKIEALEDERVLPESITNLDLRNNRISVIRVEFFKKLKKLTSLSLDNNLLKMLWVTLGSTILTHFSSANNFLQSAKIEFPIDSRGVTYVELLDLSSNDLKQLPVVTNIRKIGKSILIDS